jgi:hypothetical protein
LNYQKRKNYCSCKAIEDHYSRCGNRESMNRELLLKKGKLFCARIFVALCSFMLVFLFMECSFRLYQGLSRKEVRKFYRLVNIWPGTFDPRVGFLFKPHELVRFTNYLDFAVDERTNEMGFLDREHSPAKPAGLFRILVLGDSFVEAAQVGMKEKFHVLLEEKLSRKYPGRRFDVMAMAYSGSGTCDELAFYEQLGQAFRPDLVIIAFVNNDFSNNSPVLESIRNGWHPAHSPRLFFRKIPGGAFRRLAIDPEWEHYLLRTEDPPDSLEMVHKYVGSVFWRSNLYCFLFQRASQQSRVRRYESQLVQRYQQIKKSDDFRELLADWKWTQGSDMEAFFSEKKMPSVYQEACEVTDHVFGVFKDETDREGAHLLLASYVAGMKNYSPMVKALAAHHDIPWFDLDDELARVGSSTSCHWDHDGHWNATGHKRVAHILYTYLVEKNPDLLRPVK